MNWNWRNFRKAMIGGIIIAVFYAILDLLMWSLFGFKPQYGYVAVALIYALGYLSRVSEERTKQMGR